MLATPASLVPNSLSLTSTMMTRQEMSGAEVMEESHRRSSVAIKVCFGNSTQMACLELEALISTLPVGHHNIYALASAAAVGWYPSFREVLRCELSFMEIQF